MRKLRAEKSKLEGCKEEKNEQNEKRHTRIILQHLHVCSSRHLQSSSVRAIPSKHPDSRDAVGKIAHHLPVVFQYSVSSGRETTLASRVFLAGDGMRYYACFCGGAPRTLTSNTHGTEQTNFSVSSPVSLMIAIK